MNKVLFICSHNTGRSQMAEAILSKLGGVEFQVTYFLFSDFPTPGQGLGTFYGLHRIWRKLRGPPRQDDREFP